MKQPGDSVRKGEAFLSLIQNGKQIEILSPMTGTIIENNRELTSHSVLINADPLAADGYTGLNP